METFDPDDWSNDPMRTVVESVVYQRGAVVDTTDARSRVNGKQVIADHEAFSPHRPATSPLSEAPCLGVLQGEIFPFGCVCAPACVYVKEFC